jgi:hypothetical protein
MTLEPAGNETANADELLRLFLIAHRKVGKRNNRERFRFYLKLFHPGCGVCEQIYFFDLEERSREKWEKFWRCEWWPPACSLCGWMRFEIVFLMGEDEYLREQQEFSKEVITGNLFKAEKEAIPWEMWILSEAERIRKRRAKGCASKI